MQSTVQKATLTRAYYAYSVGSSDYTAWEDANLFLKRQAEAIASLGYTLVVEKDTTHAYDFTKSPSSQATSAYIAILYHPVTFDAIRLRGYYNDTSNIYNLFYANMGNYCSTGQYVNGSFVSQDSCYIGAFEESTIEYEDWGDFHSLAAVLANSSGYDSSYLGLRKVVFGYKAHEILVGDLETFAKGTSGSSMEMPLSFGGYKTLGGTMRDAVKLDMGHSLTTPQDAGSDKALIYQIVFTTASYGGVFDKINGGRIFRSPDSLGVGGRYTVDGVNLLAISDTYLLEDV